MLTKRFWLVLFIAIAIFCLWGLGSLPFVGPDEPRYAQVAREMLAHRELITPVLGGFPWFEKPVLLYWIVMASYSLFGVSEYAARLGPAICGLATGGLIYWIGANVEQLANRAANAARDSENRRTGLGVFSALVWFSSAGPLVFSHGLNFDILLTLTVCAALGCFLVWHLRSVIPSGEVPKVAPSFFSRFLLPAFYFSIGVSSLAKGLVGIILVTGVLCCFFVIRRELPSRKFLFSLLWGILLASAVAAIWYAPMLKRHYLIFIHDFFIEHHLQRFISNQYHHPQAFYFYVPVLLGLALPWTIFLVAAFVSARRWRWSGANAIDVMRVFCLAWIVIPVLFFSLSQSKLPAYILPVLPAIALLVGERITCVLSTQRGQLALRLTGALILLIVIVGAIGLHRNYGAGFLLIGLAVFPLVLVALTSLARPQMGKTLYLLIAIAMFVSSAISLKTIAPMIARRQSVRDLLEAAAQRGYDQTPLVQLHDIDHTAEFYGATQLIRGGDRQPMKLEGAGAVAAVADYRGGLLLCLVPTQFESQLTTYRFIRTEVIGNNGRLSLVVVKLH